MPQPEILNVPPREAVEHFRAKGYHVGFHWRDTDAAEHVRSFTAAKAMRLDILEALGRETDRAIAEGITFAEFRDRLEPRLRKLGWWGRQRMVDPVTGKSRVVQLGSPRRLRIIFDTNLRMSYARGRWERIERVAEARPFLRYVAVLDSRTRPEHRAWHGTVLRHDHPFWRTHYPPNGWRCRCTVQQLSEEDLEEFGYARGDPPAGRPRPSARRHADASGRAARAARSRARNPQRRARRRGRDQCLARRRHASRRPLARLTRPTRSARQEARMDNPTPAVTITATRDGFWRCGVAHPASPVDHPEGRWTGDELDRLRAEPALVVAATADKPAASGAAAVLDQAIEALREAPPGVVRAFLARLAEDPEIRQKAEAGTGIRAALVDAVRGLDRDDRSLWTQSGAPKVEALEAVLGSDVAAGERDAAWAAVEAERGDG